MTAHIHAAAMLQYAQDAAETDRPWERWEVNVVRGGETSWEKPTYEVAFFANLNYRRKQPATKVVTIRCWFNPERRSILFCELDQTPMGYIELPKYNMTAEVPAP